MCVKIVFDWYYLTWPLAGCWLMAMAVWWLYVGGCGLWVVVAGPAPMLVDGNFTFK
jgi:hypothetical protein